MNGAASPRSLIGQHVSNYEIVATLGAGGMGVVYKAIDLKLHRTVALKSLPPEAAGEKEKSRLLREAQAASTLDHVNVGTIYGLEEDGGRLFIAMAFYEGETLLERVRRGPASPAAALEYATQIARGLAHAHAKGVVHRDIKPSNILITTEGVLKIVDFGLAQMPSAESLTQTGTTVGTATYMSPEQVLGQEVDGRSDIWSLGVVLYEMLTGSLPFRGPSLPATLYSIVHQPLGPMTGVPAEIERIVRRCLTKEVSDRYSSAEELLRDLRALDGASSGSTLTMAVSTVGRRKFWRRGAAAGAGAAAVVAAVLLLWPVGVTRHIAVLPFRNVGNDPGGEALCDGLVETLTSRLSEFQSKKESVWVVPARDVRQRKVSDGAGARREFGATLVVTGSVQPIGKGVRLTLEVQETAQPRVVDSAVLDQAGGDLAALQDAAVARLAALMHLEAGGTRARVPDAPRAAYEWYLKGRGYMQRFDKAGSLDRAIQAFEQALAADDHFALAYAGLGESYWKQYQLTRDPAYLARATENVNRATAIDGQLTAAYITLGLVHVDAGHLALAVQEFRRALELEPHSAEGMQGLARAYEAMGRAKDAESLLVTAAALQPDYWAGYYRLGNFYYGRRRYEEAIRQYRRVLELTPDNAAVLSNLAGTYIETRRLSEAEPLLRKAIGLAPSYPLYSNLGLVYLDSERYPQAVTTFRHALALNDRDYRLWGNLGLACRYSGAQAEERQAFERAAALAEAASRLQPQDAVLQANLAKFNAWLGRRDEALVRIQAGLALAPGDQAVLKRVAETYTRLGMRREAVDAIRRALALGYPRQQLEQNQELKDLLKEPALKAR
jgi:tetratricopeptide (TPR) repeat protein